MRRCEVCGMKYSENKYMTCPYCGGPDNPNRPHSVTAPMSGGEKLAMGLIIGAVATALLVLLVLVFASTPLNTPAVVSNGGSVDGWLHTGENAEPVEGAPIEMKVRTDGRSYANDSSKSNGTFAFSLPDNSYIMVVNDPRYIPFTGYVNVESDRNEHLDIELFAGAEGSSGGVSGTINNSRTGEPVANTELNFLSGWNAFIQGMTNVEAESIAKTITDVSGHYVVDLPIGYYTVVMTGIDFVQSAFNIIVKEGENPERNGTIEPEIDETTEAVGDYLITLTWGESPRDLDSHLYARHADGSNYHVWYSDMTAYSGGNMICNLDVDDTTSYGPEHVTLKTEEDTVYYYYIHRYSSDGSIPTSSAKIVVTRGNETIRTFNVPVTGDNVIYWNVFAIKNGQIIVADTLTSDPDLSYAD